MGQGCAGWERFRTKSGITVSGGDKWRCKRITAEESGAATGDCGLILR